MKYLKLYENRHVFLRKAIDVKKLCKDSLAYIIDDGFKISVNEQTNSNDILIISLTKKENNLFNYNELKYDFIPFIEILNENYEIVKQDFQQCLVTHPYLTSDIIFIKNVNVTSKWGHEILKSFGVNIKEVLNDKIVNCDDIFKIIIKVK